MWSCGVWAFATGDLRHNRRQPSIKGRGGTETLFSRFTMIVTNRYVYIIDTDTEISKTLPDMVDFNSVAMETHGCLNFIWLFGKRFFQCLAVVPVCLVVENPCDSLFYGITERF